MKENEKVSGISLSSIKKKADKPIEFKTLTQEEFNEISYQHQTAEDDLQDAIEAVEFKDQEIQELKSHIVNLSMKLWKAKEQACKCNCLPW